MKIFNYNTVESTQDLAKKYLKNNKKTAAFIANSQTAGYGKQGRYFYSPANTGIYLSVAIPNFISNKAKIGLLTPNIATKIVETLQAYFQNRSFQLKWVNDIYINSRKIAGILTEFQADGLVIGVGININTSTFPDELSEKAGSILNDNFDRYKLTQNIIEAILSATQDYGQGLFLEKYRKLSNVIGKQVELKIGKRLVVGTAVNINDEGKLVVDVNDKLRSFSSGEITKVNLNMENE